jgi:hypothetical protein
MVGTFGTLISFLEQTSWGGLAMLKRTLKPMDDLVGGQMLNPTPSMTRVVQSHSTRMMKSISQEIIILFPDDYVFKISERSAYLARTGYTSLYGNSLKRKLLRLVLSMLSGPVLDRPTATQLRSHEFVRFASCLCQRPFIGTDRI